jgi:hypothetical protein
MSCPKAVFGMATNQMSFCTAPVLEKSVSRLPTPSFSREINPNEYTDVTWRVMQAHTVGLMSEDDLGTIVREKESKSVEYEACDTYWLLVVVDGIDAAQEQEIRIDDPHVTSGVFEKIIVFHTFGHVVEIATAALPGLEK